MTVPPAQVRVFPGVLAHRALRPQPWAQMPAVAGRKASQDPQRHSTEVLCIPSKG